MPKQTFFNLPQEKRDSIINAAVEEFAEFGLENASTNRIVKNSGIAKGSFYQYFEDKLDVFMYLLDVVEKMEMDYFKDRHPPSHNMDTFDYYRWMPRRARLPKLRPPRGHRQDPRQKRIRSRRKGKRPPSRRPRRNCRPRRTGS